MADIIQVKNLVKKYDSFVAVNDISFSVSENEVFGILGPNGAGKTTTLEMMEGLRPITSGEITIDGINVAKDPNKVKSIIGVQLQSSGFFENLTLAELLQMFGKLFGRNVNPAEILKEVELEEKSKSQVKTLSGGQKQRFSIALGLVNDPKVLFLDEPTTGLDPQARRHLWSLVRYIQSKGKTIVLTTHYMEEAEELCHRVAIMDHGKIIQLDSPDNLIDSLLAKGFTKPRAEKAANLEDVFIDLTGHELREE